MNYDTRLRLVTQNRPHGHELMSNSHHYLLIE
jgi:hypothetical protein